MAELATIASASDDHRPFPFDYDRNPAQRGWGQGWPTCPSTSALATVTCDRSGTRVTVQAGLAVLVDTMMDSIERDGYRFHPADTGAYNCRAISGTNSPSYHSWAVAIDCNWQSNPNTRYGSGRLVTDLPSWVVARWQRYGFAWGGMYLDSMHFEFMGTPSQAAQQRDLAIKDLADPTIPALPAPILYTPGDDMALIIGYDVEPDGKPDSGYHLIYGADFSMPITNAAATEIAAAQKEGRPALVTAAQMSAILDRVAVATGQDRAKV